MNECYLCKKEMRGGRRGIEPKVAHVHCVKELEKDELIPLITESRRYNKTQYRFVEDNDISYIIDHY